MSDFKVGAEGKIVKILDIVSGTSKAGKEWSKGEFVIETNDQYPKLLALTLFGDKISLIDGFNVGDEVDVYYNAESREYNGKYFHNITCWKINKANTSTTEEQQLPPEPINDDSSDDLPF